MADNTTLSTMSGGDTVRDLDRAAVKTQVVALDIAQASESELLGLGDSRTIIGTSAGLTTATTAYIAGDQLGTEITLASIVRAAKGTIIQSAVLIDKAKVVGAVDAFLFSAATTPATDNLANSWSDPDMLNLLGIIHFTDVIQSANNFAVMATNLPILIKPGSGTSVFCDLVTRTGHTFFGAVGDLQVTLGASRD